MSKFDYVLPEIERVSEETEIVRLMELLNQSGYFFDLLKYVNTLGLNGHEMTSIAITNNTYQLSRTLQITCLNDHIQPSN